MPSPYQLMGVHTKGPNKTTMDTFVLHRQLGGQMLVPGDADASLNNHWDDAKFADVQKAITDDWKTIKDGGDQQRRPHFFKSTFHRNQVQHGNATLVLEHGRDVTTELVALHPIPATVIVVPHIEKLPREKLFMLAHNTVEVMRKGTDLDQWWAAVIYMLPKNQSVDCFPFAGVQAANTA
ncbi:hypothetical protein PG985_009754 [Apiospora marii]|uniref:uncharacterized protein n=1 Tax=Apiospora marii TaxID=335849 RepID=UPI00312E1143